MAATHGCQVTDEQPLLARRECAACRHGCSGHCTGAVVICSSLLVAESPPRVIEDRLRLEIGAFLSGIDTRLRGDPSSTVQGTEISGEEDLGRAASVGLNAFVVRVRYGLRNEDEA
jgi:hypothetical protein